MRIIITGMGGFAASYLATELAVHEHQVWGIGRIAIAHSGLVTEVSHVADVNDAEAISDLFQEIQPDVVFHLAAQSNPAQSWEIYRETFDSNVSGTVETIRCAGRVESKPRFVYISSSDVYGIPDEGDLPLKETSPLMPMNPYAVSKMAAEKCVQLYACREGIEAVIVRPFSHTGPGQHASFVVPSFASQVARVEAGKQLVLAHGDLSAYRDFTDVRDVVRAYRLIAGVSQPKDVYNVCSGTSVRVEDILTQICELSNTAIRTRADNSRTRHEKVVLMRGDASRVFQDTGWQPVIPFRETLREVLDEQRALLECPEKTV